MAKSPAWTRAEGKSPSGGLNDKGRASLRAAGHDIKRPQPEGGSRRDSFCARMKGMKSKLTSSETANDPDSRINKSLRKWNCASGGKIWDKPRPKDLGEPDKLSPSEKRGAKASAKAAGRPYPNLVDNMRAARAGGGRLGSLMNAIRAYHGSPHTFEKFELSKMGSGQGAQEYGHGLYFADKEKIAKQYRGDEPGGSMYEVALHVPEKDLMQWHKPVGEQEGVDKKLLEAMGGVTALRRAVGDYNRKYFSMPIEGNVWDQPGMTWHTLLGDNGVAEKRMAEAGIPGIKYRDPNSWGKAPGKQDNNYVMFSEEPIEILRRYYKGGAVRKGYSTGGSQDVDPNDYRSRINDIYQTYLGRQADESGANFWEQQLRDTPISLADISNQFAASEEGRGRAEQIVDQIYRDRLGRDPDAAGKQFWADQIRSGNQKMSDLYRSFDQNRETRLNDLYRQELGRDLDVGARDYWMNAGQADPDWAAIRDQIAGSEEARNRARNIASDVSRRSGRSFNTDLDALAGVLWSEGDILRAEAQRKGLPDIGENELAKIGWSVRNRAASGFKENMGSAYAEHHDPYSLIEQIYAPSAYSGFGGGRQRQAAAAFEKDPELAAYYKDVARRVMTGELKDPTGGRGISYYNEKAVKHAPGFSHHKDWQFLGGSATDQLSQHHRFYDNPHYSERARAMQDRNLLENPNLRAMTPEEQDIYERIKGPAPGEIGAPGYGGGSGQASVIGAGGDYTGSGMSSVAIGNQNASGHHPVAHTPVTHDGSHTGSPHISHGSGHGTSHGTSHAISYGTGHGGQTPSSHGSGSVGFLETGSPHTGGNFNDYASSHGFGHTTVGQHHVPYNPIALPGAGGFSHGHHGSSHHGGHGGFWDPNWANSSMHSGGDQSFFKSGGRVKRADGGEVSHLDRLMSEITDRTMAERAKYDTGPKEGEPVLKAGPEPSTWDTIRDKLMGDRPSPERRHFVEGLGDIADVAHMGAYATPAAPYVGAADMAHGLATGDRLETLMSAAGLPGRAAKMAGVAAGAMAPDEAQAGPLDRFVRKGADILAKDLSMAGVGPKFRSSNIKSAKPFSEYEVQGEKIPGYLAPWRGTSIEEHQGKWVAPLLSDLSGAGERITHIGGRELSSPFETHGGGDFTRGPSSRGATPAAWASTAPAAKTYQKKLAAVVPEGEEVIGVHAAMGKPASDSSDMMVKALLRQMQAASPTKKGVTEFDKLMEEKIPGWTGVMNRETEDFLMGLPFSQRHLPAKWMDKAKWMGEGFPDVGETRFAITEPRLVNAPHLTSGYSVAKLNPRAGVMKDVEVQHPNYPGHMPTVGDEAYLGGFTSPVHASKIWNKWWENLSPKAKKKGGEPMAMRGLLTQFPIEKIDQEMVDRVMADQELHKKMFGWRKGGRVTPSRKPTQ